jgi:hypothetical protein
MKRSASVSLLLTLVTVGGCASTGGDGASGDDDLWPDADAGQPHADAREIIPVDACVPAWHNILVDPGFDENSPDWLQEPPVIGAMTPAPDTAPNAAYLAGGSSLVQELSQVVGVPADATRLRVTGKIFISTAEDNSQNVAYDRLDIDIFDEAGTKLEHLGAEPTFSNLQASDAFAPFELELAMPHAGQRVRVAFLVRTDPSITSSFVLDTLSVDAFGCGP